MIKDYNTYEYTKQEWLKYFVRGVIGLTVIGILFYSNMVGVILLLPFSLLYVNVKKQQLIKARKWQLNLEFKDGLASLSAALNAGYSIENAFYQAVADLKLMYDRDSLIVKEFESIVNQIQMNLTIEDILKNFAERSGVEDISNFADVFITSKRTGGDLIKIIRTTGNTINDKIEVKREIVTMITSKQYESNIMCMIPFGIIIYLRLCSPGLLDSLYNNLFGFLFMTVILIIYFLVYRLAQQIINIEV